MTVTDAINRGNNLLAIGIVSLSGIAFLPELFGETELPNKVDEVLLLLLAVAACLWYKTGNNKYSRSIVPILFILGSLMSKLLGIYLERKQTDDLGDDFGAITLFMLALIVTSWIYVKSKKMLKASS